MVVFRRIDAEDRDDGTDAGGTSASEARLRVVLQSLSEGVAAVSAEGCPLFVNDAMVRILGFASVDGLPRLTLAEAMARIEAIDEHGRAVAFDDRPLVRALRGETIIDMPLRIRQRLQQREYDVVNSAIPVRDARGRVTMAIVRMRDTTELRKTIKALRASQTRYEMAMRAVDAMVYDWDLATGQVERSGGVEGIVGLRPEETEPTYQWWRERIHPDDQHEAIMRVDTELTARQDRHVSEYRIRHRDGHWVRVADRGVVVYDDAGHAVRIVGSTVDVTGARAAQWALRDSEERYRSLVENANDIVATLDLELRFTTVNAAVERILGYAPAEIIGRHLGEFVPPGQLAMHREMLKRKIEGSESTRYEMQLVGRDGARLFTLEVGSKLLFDQQGRPLAIHAIARDVTERHEAEARQATLVRELQHRTRNMLAVIQSIAKQTLTGPSASAREAFIGRLHALAHAQTFVAAGRRGGVPVRQLLSMTLAAFGPRVSLVCDDTVIEGATAQSLALAVHELATNAMKHGALSVPQGCADVTCAMVEHDGARGLELSWIESLGPPVASPARTGFGTRLLQSMGDAALEYGQHGLRARLMIVMHDEPGPLV